MARAAALSPAGASALLLVCGCGASAPSRPDGPPSDVGVVDIAVGGGYACVATDERDVRCWGLLGPTGGESEPWLPREVPALRGSTRLWAAGGRVCGRLDDGAIRCLAWGPTTAIGPCGEARYLRPEAWLVNELDALSGSEELELSDDTVCGRSRSEWRCVGTNTHGELGSCGAAILDAMFGFELLAVSPSFVCGAQADSVECWGAMDPLDRPFDHRRCRDAPGTVYSLPEDVSQLDASETHVCAIGVSGGVWCWGMSSFGAFRGPPIEHIPAPSRTTDVRGAIVGVGHGWTHVLVRDATLDRVLASGATGPVVVLEMQSISVLAAGQCGTNCVLGSDGVVCWGLDYGGNFGHRGRRGGEYLIEEPPWRLPGFVRSPTAGHGGGP